MDENARRLAAQNLDHEILTVIHDWKNGAEIGSDTLDELFLRVARHQLACNQPYRRYVESQGIFSEKLRNWRDIPVLPASAFKDAELASFPLAQAAACFQTSGTTTARRGRHFMETTELYDEAAKAIFARLVLEPLGWSNSPVRLFSLAPDAEERPDSSLGHMVQTFISSLGPNISRGFLSHDTLHVRALREMIAALHDDPTPLCLIGTAIAYAHLLDALAGATLPLPPQAIVIETGGFKGRDIHLDRATLYRELGRVFQILERSIFAEFGMTELSSQYYDATSSRENTARIKIGPPWLRARIVDADGNDAKPGTVGILRHYDLANRSSVLGIETEDLAVAQGDGFVLIGREAGAELRGCSLDAEGLRALVERSS